MTINILIMNFINTNLKAYINIICSKRCYKFKDNRSKRSINYETNCLNPRGPCTIDNGLKTFPNL